MMKRGVTVMIIRCYYGVMEQNGDVNGSTNGIKSQGYDW